MVRDQYRVAILLWPLPHALLKRFLCFFYASALPPSSLNALRQGRVQNDCGVPRGKLN